MIHSTQARLNAHGQDIWVFDRRMTLEYEHDAEGNRMHTKATILSSPLSAPLVKDQRNLFGKKNEILVEGGELVGGTTQATVNQGTAIGYDQDLRKTQVSFIPGYGWVITTHEYDLEDRLVRTSASEGDYRLRIYDVAGWQHYTEDGTVSGPYQWHNMTCDANGWVLTEMGYQGGDEPSTSTTTYTGHTGEGLVTTQTVVTSLSDRTLTDTLTNHYAGFDSWQLSEVGGIRIDSTEEEPEDYSSQNAFYDSNGILSGRWGTTNDAAFAVFDGTPDGLILRGRLISIVPIPKPFWLIDERHYFHNVNGQYLASYDLRAGIIPSKINLDYGRYAVGPLGGCEITAIPESDANKDHPKSHTATMTFPPPLPDRYETQPGDSYEIIAERLCGDPSFAAAIEQANGQLPLDVGGGQKIRIPQFIPMHDAAGMSRPYSSFIETLMGSMYPEFIAKPKPVHTHHSFLKELIIAAAGVVVGIVFPELALTILNVVGPLMTALVTGVAEGLANAVTQELTIGLEGGHFSPKQVFQTAAEATLTAGMAKIIPVGETLDEARKLGHSVSMVQQLLAQAKVIVANELAEMAAGNKKAFDIRTLASSLAAAAVELQIDPVIGAAAGPVGVNAVNSTLSNLAADLATHSPIRADLIAAQIAGMSIGDAVITHLTPKQEDYHQAQQASQGQGSDRPDRKDLQSTAHLFQEDAHEGINGVRLD